MGNLRPDETAERTAEREAVLAGRRTASGAPTADRVALYLALGFAVSTLALGLIDLRERQEVASLKLLVAEDVVACPQLRDFHAYPVSTMFLQSTSGTSR